MTGRLANVIRRAGALVLVSALLVTAAPLQAYGVTPSGSTGTTASPSPAPAPAPTPTPKPKAKAPTKPTAKSTATPKRKPADTTSAIGTPGVNENTEAFRKRLAEKQAQLDAFLAQLDELDRELALASEAYNQATDRLQSTKDRVHIAESDLDSARSAFELQQDVLATRVKSIYRNGTLAWFEVMLGSDSLSDFVQRAQFLNTIGVRDAEIADSLRGQKQLVEQQVAELKTAERDAEALEFELKARKIEVMLRIQERQEMLSGAQTDLMAMLDKEAARRQSEESALFREIVSSANAKGIEVIPGTPVETVLAYHGVPYLWGGETTSGFDCSGLMLYVFKQHGVTLPHYSGSQFLLGEKVSYANLQPGDVVFFGSPIHHVGMYIGGGYFIHAPRTGDFVKISILAERNDFAGARRYPWQPRTGAILNPVKDPAAALDSVPAQ